MIHNPLRFILLVFTLAGIYSHSLAQTSANDCNLAIPACTTPSFPVVGGSGVGLVNDIPPAGSVSNPSTNPQGVNSGCLLAGELNPTFITITVTSSGLLEFSMGDGVPTGCMDWAMWPAVGGFGAGCSGIQANILPPVSCNWNGACGGYTGMASTPPTNASTGVTGSPFDFQPPLPVNPGDQFILCFSNYSGLTTTVPLDFFGTATVTCNTVVFVCPGGTANLDAPVGGSGYTWSPSTGLSATTGASVTATPSSPTSYTCIYTNSLGSSDTMSFDVMWYAPPVPLYTLTPEDCQGDDSATIVVNPTGVSPFTYALNGTSMGATNTFSPLAPGMYFVQVTDNNGCIGDTIVNVVAGPPCCTMTLDATANQVCPASCTGTANVAITDNLGSNPAVNWYNSSMTPIGQTTATATGLCAGTYYVEVTDSTLCTLIDTAVITSFPGVSITSVTVTNASCSGVCDGGLIINHTGGAQFSIDNGATFQASNTFTALCDGPYNIVIQSADGCTASITATVNEAAPLNLVIDAIDPVNCFGGSDGSILTSIGGGTAPYGALWSDGSTALDNIGIPAGNYTLNVTDANGCTASVSGTVTEPTSMTLNMLIDSVTCNGYCDGRVTAVPGGGSLPYSYNWSSGIAGSSATVANDVCAGTYSLIVTDAMGCTVDSLNFPVSEPQQVQVGTVLVKSETCYASCDGYIVVNSPDPVSYSIDGGNIYFANNTFLNLCEGTYDVFVKDIDGCLNSQTVTIDRPLEVIADFSFGPQPTDIFETSILFDNLSVNASNYTWYYDSTGTSQAFEEQYQFPEYMPGNYNVCLVAVNDSGCVDSICHIVVIDDYTYLYLPNTFTPNGDGNNEIFTPIINNIEEEGYSFRIFNRWGEIVFSTGDPTEGWDGTHKGIKSKEDTYVWKLKAKSKLNAEKKEWIGHVNLLR